jgi:hypothetical protein
MKARTPPVNESEIDALYGLEPVIDPASERTTHCADEGTVCFMSIQCPYCGEPFETQIDSSAGSSSYIEDCHVCCRPIQIGLEVATDGVLQSVSAERSD